MKLDNTLYEVIQQMRKRGGSFVQSLAECLGFADDENRDAIIKAFPHIIERYDAWASLARKEKELEETP